MPRLIGWKKAVDDANYAAAVFDGVVAYDRVIASRRWHLEPAEPWDCTFAIVQLSDAAAETPDEPSVDEVAWYLSWGGDWQVTPADHPGWQNRDAIRECAHNWSPEVETKLLMAIAEPGSWYAHDGIGDVVYVYSLKQRIAARIRLGD